MVQCFFGCPSMTLKTCFWKTIDFVPTRSTNKANMSTILVYGETKDKDQYGKANKVKRQEKMELYLALQEIFLQYHLIPSFSKSNIRFISDGGFNIRKWDIEQYFRNIIQHRAFCIVVANHPRMIYPMRYCSQCPIFTKCQIPANIYINTYIFIYKHIHT